jgi:tetratricopeptide (TPR) repeat protein
VVYGELLHEQAHALDRRIVDGIQRVYAGRLGERVERLAHHAFRGEMWDLASDYLRMAGRRALLASANAQAVAALEQALVALSHLPQAPATLGKAMGIRLILRDALWSLGRIGPLHHHLQAAEAIARHLADQRALGQVACYQCHYFWAVAELEAAQEAGQRAVDIAVSLGDALLLGETELYRGIVCLAQGRCEEATHVLGGALVALERVGREPGRAGRRATTIGLLVRCFLTRALAELGRFEEGAVYGEEALRLAEAERVAFGLVTALAGLGSLHLRRAAPERAVPLLERGLDICRSYDINNWRPTIGASLGAAYAAIGRADEAIRLAKAAVDLDSEMGLTATLSLWRVYLGEAYLAAGRLSEAHTEARRALVECRERKERGYEAWALYLLGRIGGRQGPRDAEEARTSYRRALTLAEPLGMRPLVARCLAGLARLSDGTDDAAMASAYGERARRLAVELGVPLASFEAA